jgi:hypothetical protein
MAKSVQNKAVRNSQDVDTVHPIRMCGMAYSSLSQRTIQTRDFGWAMTRARKPSCSSNVYGAFMRYRGETANAKHSRTSASRQDPFIVQNSCGCGIPAYTRRYHRFARRLPQELFRRRLLSSIARTDAMVQVYVI